MNIKVALTILIIISCLHAQGQAVFDAGYIVKSNGDSVHGFISKPTSDYTTMKFKAHWGDKYQIYSSLDVKSFGVSGSCLYQSSKVILGNDVKVGFYEVLLESKISLYYAGDYYVHLEDGRFVMIEKNSFSRSLATILTGNCLYKLAQRATKLSWSKTELVLFFRDYNDCLNAATIVHHVDKLNVNFGGGVGYSSLTTSGNDVSRPDLGSTATSDSHEYFVFANSTIPGVNNMFRIHFIGSYSPGHSFLIDFQEGNTYYETQFKLAYFQIESSLRYHLNVGSKIFISPGVGIGLGLVRSIFQSRIIERVEGNTVFTSDDSNNLELSKMNFTMSGMLTIGYQVSPKYYLFTESRIAIGGKLLVIDENRTNVVSGRIGMGFSLLK